MRQPEGVDFILGTLISCLISQPDNEQRKEKEIRRNGQLEEIRAISSR